MAATAQSAIAVIGIDIGKNSFHVVGLDGRGAIVLRERPFALLPAEWIEALLDAKPPHAARSWLVTLRSLCQFAVKRGFRRDDPTRDIKQRSVKGDGFHTWTDDEIAQFEAHHAIGTKPRLGLALLLYTAQRRSDVVRIGRQHIKDGVLTVKQQKTG